MFESSYLQEVDGCWFKNKENKKDVMRKERVYFIVTFMSMLKIIFEMDVSPLIVDTIVAFPMLYY